MPSESVHMQLRMLLATMGVPRIVGARVDALQMSLSCLVCCQFALPKMLALLFVLAVILGKVAGSAVWEELVV